MIDNAKTVEDTALVLGVCKQTVFNLLRVGELQRAPAQRMSGKGRPITMVTLGSIVEYRNRRRSKR